jgi:hypothetical protein
MRVIFEEVDEIDYFEIILRPKEVAGLTKKGPGGNFPYGIVRDFPQGLYGKRNLNVYVRVEENDKYLTKEDYNAIK